MGALLGAAALDPFIATEKVWAWSNGSSSDPAGYRKLAAKTPDIHDWRAYSMDNTAERTGKGLGTGTHDLILEQAIAGAIRGGADVSWIETERAREATSAPDYDSKLNRYSPDHTYHGLSGYKSWGTVPRAAGQLYNEICDCLAKGDHAGASDRLGWMAHYLGDLTQPMHVATSKQMRPLDKLSYTHYHRVHVQCERDLDHYIKRTVCYKPSDWAKDADLKKVAGYVPGLKELTDETYTPPKARMLWFGGSVYRGHAMTHSVRASAQIIADRICAGYATQFCKRWAKVYKLCPGESYTNGNWPFKPGATDYLVKSAPGMLHIAIIYLASAIYALSTPRARASGQDHIRSYSVSLRKRYFKAGGKRYCSVTARVKVRVAADGHGWQRGLPIKFHWYKDKAKEAYKGGTLYTLSDGTVESTCTYKRTKKKIVASFAFYTPTGNHHKTATSACTKRATVAAL